MSFEVIYRLSPQIATGQTGVDIYRDGVKIGTTSFDTQVRTTSLAESGGTTSYTAEKTGFTSNVKYKLFLIRNPLFDLAQQNNPRREIEQVFFEYGDGVRNFNTQFRNRFPEFLNNTPDTRSFDDLNRNLGSGGASTIAGGGVVVDDAFPNNPFDTRSLFDSEGNPTNNYNMGTGGRDFTSSPENLGSGISFAPGTPGDDETYSNTAAYVIAVLKYRNDILDENYTQLASNFNEILFKFELKSIAVDTGGGGTDTPKTTNARLNVVLSGVSNSANIIINNNLIRPLTRGKNVLTLDVGTKIFVVSTNTQQYRIVGISTIGLEDGSKELRATEPNESLSAEFVLQNDTSVTIETDVLPNNTLVVPKIAFVNEKSLSPFNLNQKTNLPIGILSTGRLDRLTAFIDGKPYVFSNINQQSLTNIITIPFSAFQKIGNYKVIVVGNISGNDTFPIETIINVTANEYVGTPDVTNIVYPSLIKGGDYQGTLVEFEISWNSVNTDYVILGKLGTDIQSKLEPNGKRKFLFDEILKLGGTQIDEVDGFLSVTLTLTPYNDSTSKLIKGKTESFNIKFDAGDLTIPRPQAINRLSEAFLSQLNDNELQIDSSKYLTHLLHLGGADNKVVTTWTGSEGSLILKLYEPLPTSVQPNDQVWISKLKSNPIVETVSISSIDEMYCPPLKGPNFSLEPDNGIGYKVFDDLIASGSETSNSLINRYLNDQGIDTSQLNIQYVSGSEYIFENFSHFGSIEERVNNFFYKIQLLETYKERYEDLTDPTKFGDDLLAEATTSHETYLTLDGYQLLTEDGIYDIQWQQYVYKNPTEGIEAERVLTNINEILRGWDGFETWVYTNLNDLAYPKRQVTAANGLITYALKPSTEIDVIAWYEALVTLAAEYDKNNPNYLVNNIPEFIREDYQNGDFITFLDLIGQHFDIIWSYINGLRKTKVVDERYDVGVSDKLVWYLLKSMGWDGVRAYDSQFLWEYAFGTDRDGFKKYRISLEQANNEIWRRIINNLPYLLKHKGTSRAMKAVMACYGVPTSLLTIMEFGGPTDPDSEGTQQFTFDDRTAAIKLEETSKLIVPWKEVNGEYPSTIEFNFKPDNLSNTPYTLISASEWTLDLVQTTGSLGRLELNFGGDVGDSSYFLSGSSPDYPYIETTIEYVYGPDLVTGSLDFPISTENYSNICINRTDYAGDGSLYEVWLATSDGNRIITSVSMSIFTEDAQWTTGTEIRFGGNGFVGNLDEFRLWRVPLQRSKFEIHALQPDSIAGNSYTASTEDLLFRLDFERPKDRTKTENVGILNVAINETYGETYGFANNFYSASSYPYQYTPYERTVTATVPSLGMNLSNKIRFEEQTLISNLSHKTRATQKSFDRAPIDSSRLGLFFSPIKELNMDIVRAFGKFNIDNYIGDPSDEYRDTYRELEDLRTYYFQRLNRNINEYIRLVKYISKSLFDVLADLAPARAKVSKGLLIEPHYLERSKTRWDKPTSQRNDFETNIDTYENVIETATFDTYTTTLNIEDETELTSELKSFVGEINEDDSIELVGSTPFYDGLINYDTNDILEGTYPTYHASINAEFGATVIGEADAFSFQAIGMDGNSLANLGYGLYAERGVGIWRRYDFFGNVTSSRQNMYVVREEYTQRVPTQTAGWPTLGALPGEQVKYENVTVTKDRYRISLIPFSGSLSLGGGVAEVTPINGYLPTHYKFVNNLSEGLQLSYFKGSKQTAATTPDGLSPVETFTTNPNILRVADTGRGSGEPILIVD
jgi:hypothetical protein